MTNSQAKALLKIERVINSCVNEKQLNNVRTWISKIAINVLCELTEDECETAIHRLSEKYFAASTKIKLKKCDMIFFSDL